MRRILLIVEFMGSAYLGLQSQAGGKTVQDTIEDALLCMTGAKIRITAAGRTDAGVHAYAMPIHFDTDKPYPPEKFRLALNNFLPDDIRVIEAREVASDFHARFDAQSKTYLYKTYVSRTASPLRRLTHARVLSMPDISAMRIAAQMLTGEHDFAAFCAQGSNPHTTVRRITSIEITQPATDEIHFTVSGNGFLRNMVRIIVALLLNIGLGKQNLSAITAALNSRDRTITRAVAPAEGLYLLEVKYN